MADPLRTGQQRIGELLLFEIEIALHLLEPFHRVPRRRLQFQHLDAAFLLIFRKSGFTGRLGFQVFRESNGAFQGQFRAGTDGEMRGRRSIAHQHDIFVMPFLAKHTREIQPGGTTQMSCIADQRIAAEVIPENLLTDGNALILGFFAETVGIPGLLAAFNDESRGFGIELIGMSPDPALRCFLEDEGESIIKFRLRAEPGEFQLPVIHIRFEHILMRGANAGIQPVTGDDDIILLRKFLRALKFALKAQFNAEFARPILKEEEKLLAPDAAKTMAGGNRALSGMNDSNIIPIGEMFPDRRCQFRVIFGEVIEGLVRENHTPAESVIKAVALDHHNFSRRITSLHRDRKIETGWPPAETRNPHEFSPHPVNNRL